MPTPKSKNKLTSLLLLILLPSVLFCADGATLLEHDPNPWLRWGIKNVIDEQADLAIKNLKKAMSIAEKENPQWDKKGLCLQTLTAAYLLNHELGLANKTLHIVAQDDQLKGVDYFQMILLQAQITRSQGHFQQANRAVDEAIKLAQSYKQNDKRLRSLVAAYRAKAANTAAYGDFLGCLQILKSAFEPAKNSGELLTITDLCRDQSHASIAMNNHKTAYAFANQSLSYDLIRNRSSKRKGAEDWIAKGDQYVAKDLLLLGQSLAGLGKSSEAHQHISYAERLARRLDNKVLLAHALSLNAEILSKAHNSPTQEIQQYCTEAAALVTQTEMPPVQATVLARCGKAMLSIKQVETGHNYLNHSLQLVESLRLHSSGPMRRDWLASQIEIYRWLINYSVQQNDPLAALHFIESSNARQLKDQLGIGSPRSLESGKQYIKTLQQHISDDLSFIIYANADSNTHTPVAVVINKNTIQCVQLPVQGLLGALDQVAGTAIRAIQAESVELQRLDQSNAVSLGGAISLYRESIVKASPQNIPLRRPLAQEFFKALVKPCLQHCADHKRIVIVPNGMLCYLPFQTLLDNNNYFGQSHTINLTHGFEITAELAKRPTVQWQKPLLAFGGAVYNPGTYQADMAKQLSTLGKYQYLLEQRSAAQNPAHTPYAHYVGAVQTNLPGTKAEVLALSKIIEHADIRLGTQVYEPDIHQMAAQGLLKQYRCLHFAVHGSANPYKPELSALLLSAHKKLQKNTAPKADGFLSVSEIQALDLRCEMVILSACETGQGSIYAGQGVVGLTQAFLSAGADQLIASLWPVGDASTAQFMVRVYELRLNKNMDWPNAVATTQREFINGDFGKAQQQPIAWAPFNLYGAPDAFVFP